MQRHGWRSGAGVGESGAWMEKGSCAAPRVCVLFPANLLHPMLEADPEAERASAVWHHSSVLSLLQSRSQSWPQRGTRTLSHRRSVESGVLPLTPVSISRSSLEKISASVGVIFSCLSSLVMLSCYFCSPRYTTCAESTPDFDAEVTSALLMKQPILQGAVLSETLGSSLLHRHLGKSGSCIHPSHYLNHSFIIRSSDSITCFPYVVAFGENIIPCTDMCEVSTYCHGNYSRVLLAELCKIQEKTFPSIQARTVCPVTYKF